MCEKTYKNIYNLDLEVLVGMAYSTKITNGESPIFISYDELENFAAAAIHVLRRDFNEDANLVLGRDLTDDFFYENSDLFMRGEVNRKEGVAIKKRISSSDMIRRTSVGALPLNLFLAFSSAEALKCLGINNV